MSTVKYILPSLMSFRRLVVGSVAASLIITASPLVNAEDHHDAHDHHDHHPNQTQTVAQGYADKSRPRMTVIPEYIRNKTEIAVSNYPLFLLSEAVTKGAPSGKLLLQPGDVGHHGSSVAAWMARPYGARVTERWRKMQPHCTVPR